MYFIYIVVNKVVDILNILLLIRVVISWISMDNAFTRAVYSVTEPILAPIRRAIYPLTRNFPIDFSVIIAYFLIRLLRDILFQVLALFFY